MDVTVGFRMSAEQHAALLKLAGKRQADTGERVDKSVLLREAVAAYLVDRTSENFGSDYEHAVFIAAAIVDGLLTRDEARAVIEQVLRRARFDQRAHDEREWSGANDAT